MKKTSLLLSLLAVFIFASSFMIGGDKDPKIGTNIGDKAPEIEMTNPDGKVMKLSDLKGNYVLIDFWASWCGPCRRENPAVVGAYEQFKDKKFKGAKGFTIYSVSLDKSKEAWEKAIVADNLKWPYHVSDLQAWNNKAAREYGIRGIPANYLVDADGIIVEKDLRGARLANALAKYTK